MPKEMKIAGLIPHRPDPEKDMLAEVLDDLRSVCDEVIMLYDRTGFGSWRPDLTENMWIEGGDGVWSDFLNRTCLLARAAKYDCRWVVWADSDERLGPTLTRARVLEICEQADKTGCPVVEARCRTAWNETQWRCDGLFKEQRKQYFQVNPFMVGKSIEFDRSPQARLHSFPTLKGPIMTVDDHIIHWGLRTRSLREKNVARYEAADPKQEFSPIPYNYLLDEKGLKLAPIVDPPRFLIIMPTRGRRWNALEAIASVMRTATHPEFVDIVVCQDEDDEEAFKLISTQASSEIVFHKKPRMRFISWINFAVATTDLRRYDFVAWFADDVRLLTPGWDTIVATHKELVVYGKDGHHNEKMATHPFISTAIPRALGYLAPSELVHLCPDTFIEALAREIGSIAYDPAIHTEHLHYDCSGKGKFDQTYADAKQYYAQDKETFETVIRPRIPELAKTVKDFMEREKL